MPMFDDPKKELQWLQEQLLAEEEQPQPEFDEDAWLDEALAEAKVLSGYQESTQPVRNYANGYGAQPTQPRSPYQRPIQQNPGQPTSVQEPQRSYLSGYSTYQESRPQYVPQSRNYDEVIQEETGEKGIGGLVALAILLTGGIVAVAMYWVLVLL